MKNGKLIVIEGLDGSGKKTQTSLICERIRKETSKEVTSISFPDYADPSSTLVTMYLAGKFGELDKVNPYGASLFYTVDRYASYMQHWADRYRRGDILIADRYTTSNITHQMGRIPKERWDEYLSWLDDTEYTRVGLPRPDMVIYLDTKPEVSIQQMNQRYHNDETKKDIHESNKDFLVKSRESGLYGANKLGWSIIKEYNEDTMLSIEDVHERIWELVSKIVVNK